MESDLRRWMRLVETSGVFVHGSEKPLPVGTILRPGDDYMGRWGRSFIYLLVAKHRPKGRLPHEKSVFFVKADNIDDLYHAGGPDDGSPSRIAPRPYLFTVKPIGEVQRHNLAWLEPTAAPASWSPEKVIPMIAYHYWMGLPCEGAADVWEYVAPAAEVIAVDAYSRNR